MIIFIQYSSAPVNFDQRNFFLRWECQPVKEMRLSDN